MVAWNVCYGVFEDGTLAISFESAKELARILDAPDVVDELEIAELTITTGMWVDQ